MPKAIEVTLYDVFGYLLPGCIVGAAIVILFGAICLPATPLRLPQTIDGAWLAVLVGAAYVAGHLAQAIGNIVVRLRPSTEQLMLASTGKGSLDPALVASVRTRAGALLRIDTKNTNPGMLYRICDETVVQWGDKADRDVYIYREGFYRGLAIAFLALFAALVTRMLIPGAALALGDTVHPLTTSMLLFVTVLAFIATALCFRRYRRFGRYRVAQAVVGFLLLFETKVKDGAAE